MKKLILAAAAMLLTITILCVSIIGASAAVYVQDGKFKYQIFDNGTVAWAGYTSDTVDNVTIPRFYDKSTVVSVANFGLENNSAVRSVDFMEAPDLYKIGMYAFHKCSSLESVLVPNSITDVDVSAFRECTSLTDVTFYGNENVVPVECFYKCSSLSNVRLSARVKSIQSHAFAGCTSLEYLEMSDTIEYIAPNAFDGDENLTLGVWYGTYAHTYAVENDINYILLDGVKLGDVNGDGIVNINDVTAIQQHLAEYVSLKGIFLHAADADQNGEVKIDDATLLQEFLAEYTVGHPVGEVMTQ